jgi:diguanylate cyclase (GGDEF)-like protein
LPFATRDPLELVHCHIALLPAPPHTVNPMIPEGLSNLVMKLLSKTVDVRYQSSWGIQADLLTCQQQWVTTGEIVPFPLAQHDRSGYFQIPRKLYGREQEIASLQATVARVMGKETKKVQTGTSSILPSTLPSPRAPSQRSHCEIVLVTGYAGVGKTSLVQELYPLITARRGYFVAGKFDQFQQDMPYSAVVSALTELVRQVLSQADAQFNGWRDRLQAALGNNGQVMIAVIPELELIIGKQPPVPELEPQAAQNRFTLVFQNFIRVFCTAEHPLAIFLDDLQWADAATLSLLKLILTDNHIQSLLLIGAYRDNEVDSIHPLRLTLKQLQAEGIAIHHVALQPLTLESVNQLIADTLQQPAGTVRALSQLVWQKTAGNPFFVNEFLKMLRTTGLIWFDWQNHGWQWDLTQIESQGITDNVGELLTQKLQQLPNACQSIVQLAACLGSRFDLRTLSIISEQSVTEVYASLAAAIQSGLVVAGAVSDQELLNQIFQFAHDRIQQTAYALIPTQQKSIIHRLIGQHLLNHTATSPLEDTFLTGSPSEDNLFAIVNHLNAGIDAIVHPLEREQLAWLNLGVGKRAKAAIAYQRALVYLRQGLNLLTSHCWQSQYALTLELHIEAVEVSFLLGKLEDMEALTYVALKRSRTLLDRVKFYEVNIKALIVQNKPKEAIEIGLNVLKLLGIRLPKKATRWKAIVNLLQIQWLLFRKHPDDLLQLPLMTAPNQLAAKRIGASISAAAYVTKPELIPSLLLTSLRLSIRYGNSPYCPEGYSGYGLLLCTVLGNIPKGYRLGELGLRLVEKLDAKPLKAKNLLIFNGFIRHWQDHARETLQPLLEAYGLAIDVGDLVYAAICLSTYVHRLYEVGQPLTTIEPEMHRYSRVVQALNEERNLLHINVSWQTVLNLMGRSNHPCELTGEACHESEILQAIRDTDNQILALLFYACKLQLYYRFGEYEQALECAAFARRYLNAGRGLLLGPICYFYDSLTRLALCSTRSQSSQKRHLKRVRANQQQLKYWADHAPANHLHKFYLVEAEFYRLLGHVGKAMKLYDRAIDLARNQHYLNEESLGYELAAGFYLSQGRERVAHLYLHEAYYRYRQWGAMAKMQDLEARYPQFFKHSASETAPLQQSVFRPAIDSLSEQTSTLDLRAIMQASQALSEEIVLEKLLKKLMQTILESAGAQQGWLIQESAGQWRIEAGGATETINVLQSIPLDGEEGSHYLPNTLIAYVSRTQESIVLDDATQSDQFAQDSYILSYRPKSVLCAPLMHQGTLIAIVYLENNLTTGAFTADRVDVVKLLCAQAAIALENAQFYADKVAYTLLLEQNVAERTAELEQLNRELQQLASLDGLTQLANRRRFDEYLEQEWKRLSRQQQPLSLILADVDYFKKYNDLYGHQSGDDCLKQVAKAMQQSIKRPSDLVARYGGEEFAVVLPFTDITGAITIAQTLQRAIQQLQIPHTGSEVSPFVTLSLGIACVTPTANRSLETLVAATDAALYQAKRQGRNRWVCAPESQEG